MKIPTGKGMFVWRIERIGTPASIAAQAKAAGFSHVLVKIADGVDFDDYPQAGQLVNALHEVGIEAYGWQYVYLYSSVLEAEVGARRCIYNGCDGFVIDAERQCKDNPLDAAAYCERLAYLLPDEMSIGLSSYRFPSLHPELPWDILRGVCAYDIPQVYWEQAHNPADQLYRSYAEFKKFKRQLPYIPTGAAYPTSVWKPTPADIEEFIAACGELNLGGYNFWEWYCAQKEVPELWPVIIDDAPEHLIPDTMLFEALVDNQNVRTGPALSYRKIGNLAVGQVLEAQNIAGSDAWAEIAPGQWCAVKIGGTRFLRTVKE